MLVFALLTFVIITSPEYVQCSSILPDEALDFPGISGHSTLLRPYTRSISIIYVFIFDFSPIPVAQQGFSSESFSPPRAIFEMFPSAILRC
jgi:hypothetical protein